MRKAHRSYPGSRVSPRRRTISKYLYLFLMLGLLCFGLLLGNVYQQQHLPLKYMLPEDVHPVVAILNLYSSDIIVSDVLARYASPTMVHERTAFVLVLPETFKTVPHGLGAELSNSFPGLSIAPVALTASDDPSASIRDSVGLALTKFPTAKCVVLLSASHEPRTPFLMEALIGACRDRGVIASCTTVTGDGSSLSVVDNGLESTDGTVGGRSYRYISRRFHGMPAGDIRVANYTSTADFVTPHCLVFPRAASDLLIASTQQQAVLRRPRSAVEIGTQTAKLFWELSQLQDIVTPLVQGSDKNKVAVQIALYMRRVEERIRQLRRQFSLEPLPQLRGNVSNSLDASQDISHMESLFSDLLLGETELEEMVPDVLQLMGDVALLRFAHAARVAGFKIEVLPAHVQLNPWATPKWAQELLSLGFPLLKPSIFAAGRYFPVVDGTTLTGNFKGDTEVDPATSIVWDTVCCGCCGFSTEIMHFLLPLQRLNRVRLTIGEDCFCSGFAAYARDTVSRMTFGGAALSKLVPPSDILIWISHAPPWAYYNTDIELRRPDYFIGRTMYEFTKISKTWVARIESINEVWVPARWVRDVFLANGVPKGKILVMPEAVDTSFFDPDNRGRFALPGDIIKHQWSHFCNIDGSPGNYVFFSNFKWEMRKGWDILFRAYFGAFSQSDPVSLYVLTNVVGTLLSNASQIGEQFSIWLNSTEFAGYPLDQLPHFCVITESLDELPLADLYNTADAFVLPTRGEGWGLPTIQAMALAKPTISTAWGGQMEFMTQDTSFLIDIDGLDELPVDSDYGFEPGKKWAVPSLEHTKVLLRYIIDHREHAAAVGQRARLHIIKHFSEVAVAQMAHRRFREITAWIKHLRKEKKH